MLLWQPNGLNPHTVVKLKLLAFSVLLHCCMLLMLFVVYRGYYAQMHIDISKTVNAQVPVVFLPLHKQLNTGGRVASAKTVKSKITASAAKKIVAPKAPTRIQPVAPKTPARIKPKKNKAKKLLKKKQIKKELPKVEPKKEIVEQPVEPIKVEPHKQEALVAPQEVIELPVKQDTVEHQSQHADAAQEAIYIGQLEQDALLMQQAIEQEMQEHWKPPAGLSPDLGCTIQVVVGWDGAIGQLTIQEKSGVLAFDVHAKNALLAMNFPKAAWGKELVIHFKQ